MYIVTISDPRTGESKEEVFDLEWGEGSYFWWDEGNMSCNCNRSLLMGWEGECDGWNYLVNIKGMDGVVLYEETLEDWLKEQKDGLRGI